MVVERTRQRGKEESGGREFRARKISDSFKGSSEWADANITSSSTFDSNV